MKRLQKIFMVLAILLIAACQQEEDNNMAVIMNGGNGGGIGGGGNGGGNVGIISALPLSADAPANNPSTNEKRELGRMLFWDPILSGGQDVACASCHHPSLGYADGLDLSQGVDGQGLGPNRRGGMRALRNAPTILNTAFNGIGVLGNYNPANAPMFWDNRAFSLETQSGLPILSEEEMRGIHIQETDIMNVVLSRINAIPTYRNLFAAAFGTGDATDVRLRQAIAVFQRSLVADNSPFDQYMRGNLAALSNQEIEGMNTFIDVGCADCHSGPMFSDYELHTLSVPDHPLVADNGATGNFDFRTPTLRNLNMTAPYMHNGSFDNLRDVLEFYDDISRGNGNSQNPNVQDNQIDADARNLNLNNNEINEIIDFLNTLNDPNFDRSIPQSVPSGLPVGGNIQ